MAARVDDVEPAVMREAAKTVRNGDDIGIAQQCVHGRGIDGGGHRPVGQPRPVLARIAREVRDLVARIE